jgi:hypothetical protein
MHQRKEQETTEGCRSPRSSFWRPLHGAITRHLSCSSSRIAASCTCIPTECSGRSKTPRLPPRSQCSRRGGAWPASRAGALCEPGYSAWRPTSACGYLRDDRAGSCRSTTAPPAPIRAISGEPLTEPIWLEPLPDDLISDDALDPAAAYLRRESVELAFIAALQHLPTSQRAVLILRDVLGFSSAEVAGTLGALQRARATMARRAPQGTQQAELAALGPDGRSALIAAFASAWERADVLALRDLLAEDARFTMPPLPAWFDGRHDVVRFLAERVFATPWRLASIGANGQLAFACYQFDGARFRLGAVNVLSLRDSKISWIAGFVDPQVLGRLPVPVELPQPDR